MGVHSVGVGVREVSDIKKCFIVRGWGSFAIV